MDLNESMKKAEAVRAEKDKNVGRMVVDDAIRAAEKRIRTELKTKFDLQEAKLIDDFKVKVADQEQRLQGTIADFSKIVLGFQATLEQTKRFFADQFNAMGRHITTEAGKRAAMFRCLVESGHINNETFLIHYEDVRNGIVSEAIRCQTRAKDYENRNDILRCNLEIGHKEKCQVIPYGVILPEGEDPIVTDKEVPKVPEIKKLATLCKCGNYLVIEDDATACVECGRKIEIKEGEPIWEIDPEPKEECSDCKIEEGSIPAHHCPTCGKDYECPREDPEHCPNETDYVCNECREKERKEVFGLNKALDLRTDAQKEEEAKITCRCGGPIDHPGACTPDDVAFQTAEEVAKIREEEGGE